MDTILKDPWAMAQGFRWIFDSLAQSLLLHCKGRLQHRLPFPELLYLAPETIELTFIGSTSILSSVVLVLLQQPLEHELFRLLRALQQHRSDHLLHHRIQLLLDVVHVLCYRRRRPGSSETVCLLPSKSTLISVAPVSPGPFATPR